MEQKVKQETAAQVNILPRGAQGNRSPHRPDLPSTSRRLARERSGDPMAPSRCTLLVVQRDGKYGSLKRRLAGHAKSQAVARLIRSKVSLGDDQQNN